MRKIWNPKEVYLVIGLLLVIIYYGWVSAHTAHSRVTPLVHKTSASQGIRAYLTPMEKSRLPRLYLLSAISTASERASEPDRCATG